MAALTLLCAAPAQAVVNAEAEVAAAMFSASATLAAFQKSADAKLRTERQRIVALRSQLKKQRAQAGAASAALGEAETKLAAAERDFVARLAEKDRSYAEEIAVFRGQVTDIAATPEGAEALAMFNDGDELGAIAILDQLHAANDAARERRTAIESAAEGRRIANLALEARARGKLGTAEVIARFEDVVAKDPGVFWDWVKLRRLYFDAGRLAGARRAAGKAIELAANERDRSVALNQLGDVEMRAGNLTGARQAYEEMLAIDRRSAAADPGNAQALRDLSVSLDKLGNVEMRAGNLTGARQAYEEMLAIRRRSAAADPGNAQALRDLSVSLNKLGNVEMRAGNLTGARQAYEESLAIRRRSAAADPGNAEAQRDLSVSLNKLGNVAQWADDLAIARRLAAAEAQRDLAARLDTLGDDKMEADDLVAARQAYKKSLAVRRRLAAADPGNAQAQRDLSVNLNRLGNVEMLAGDLAAARLAHEESIAILRRLDAADPGNAQAQTDLWAFLFGLARLDGSGVIWADVLEVMEYMHQRGTLADWELRFLEQARANAAKEATANAP